MPSPFNGTMIPGQAHMIPLGIGSARPNPLDWQTIVCALLYVIKGMQNAPPDHQAIIE